MMSTDPEATRARIEARFRKKEDNEASAKVVRAEMEARKVAVQANTERLRALRIAKEAADKVRAAGVQTLTKQTSRKADPHAARGSAKVRSKIVR